MKLLKKGAEAELYLTEFLERKALLKKRAPKKYRNQLLDEKIRRERTAIECSLLHKAKEAGVRTPVIYSVDRKECAITMEFIEGKQVKKILNEKNLRICREIGENIARMHSAGIIHGDLTTSNILLHGKALVFVDFGLAFNSGKTEDKAMDLLVFRKTFEATHFNLAKGWGKVVEGYLAEESGGRDAVKRIAEIEARARYH
ncbi:MAG: KEOPS complex kinase/ATPase Bud32 [Candidatus Diapherotrites archaeon]